MAQINIRVDDSVKRGAEQVFEEIGLSMNAAVTVFLKTCAREKRIPFELSATAARQNLPGGVQPLLGTKRKATKKVTP